MVKYSSIVMATTAVMSMAKCLGFSVLRGTSLRLMPRKTPHRTVAISDDMYRYSSRSTASATILSRRLSPCEVQLIAKSRSISLQATSTEEATDVTRKINKNKIQNRRQVPKSKVKGVKYNQNKNKAWNRKNNSKKGGNLRPKNNKKNGRKKKKTKNKQTIREQTVGDNGRQIMTYAKLKNNIVLSAMNVNTNNALTFVHNMQQGDRLIFTQHLSHLRAEGSTQHDNAFIATIRTTLPVDELATVPQDAQLSDDGTKVDLCNTGKARSKKDAQRLAAADFLLQLKSECGVDPLNLPTRQQRFKEKVLPKAQMLLELFSDGWPRIRTREAQPVRGPVQFETELSMRMSHSIRDDRWINIIGPSAKSKSESQSLAFVEASGEPLEEIVGRDRVAAMKAIIDQAPANHIAALKVQPLPSKAFATLSYALGSMEGHSERMAELERRQEIFEERFSKRMESSWHGKVNRAKEQLGKTNLSEKELEEKHQLQTIMEREEAVRLENAVADPEGPQGSMKAVRDALPIIAIKHDLTKALQTEQVVVVSGGTGSGKSTQCPQYILEDAIARGQGADTRIIVTQPRRIAAISVAERMAEERDEALGNSVGYSVRLNSVQPRQSGSVEFVTTGVLLRRLMHDPTIEGVSHVIIDEVHERDINTDFLLVLLRDLVAIRPDLRVVLMSATLDANSFSQYFTMGRKDRTLQVPLMSVPTKPRHPVNTIHLEDIAGEDNERKTTTEVFPSGLQELARSLLKVHDEQLQEDLEEAEAEEQAADELERLSAAEDEGDLLFDDEDVEESAGPSSRLKSLRQAVEMRGSPHGFASIRAGRKKMTDRDVNTMGISLLAKMVQHVAEKETNAGRKGSILCFLPGWDEIKAAMSLLEEECHPNLYDQMTVLPLHSTIPKEEQHRIFEPAAEGKVKVILATNIAESSVTINDVIAIVDSGLVREMNWDAESAMSTMVTQPTSRASVTQRTGRAGRVAPGTCYRLFSRGSMEAMYERPTPEIKRTGLENTCLQTCSMTRDGVQDFLSRAMDPPERGTISVALDRLEKLGAIKSGEDGSETLTPLGRLLSRLPLDPSTGRMLIIGCVMKCLDPVLTAAALFSSRDPFYTPPGMRDEARKIRQSFCEDSDLMASIRAFDEYNEITRNEGWQMAREWASDNFISTASLKTISSVKSQLLNELQRIGLIHNRDLVNFGRMSRKILREDASVNQHADNEALYKAVCAQGLPDNLASRRQLGHFGTLRTRMEAHAGLHPSSVAFHRKPPERGVELPNWFLYNEMVLSSQVFIRHCTAIEPEQILLFGGNSLKRLENDQTFRQTATEREVLLNVVEDSQGEEDKNVDELNKELDNIFDTILNKSGGPKLMKDNKHGTDKPQVPKDPPSSNDDLDGMFDAIFDEEEGISRLAIKDDSSMIDSDSSLSGQLLLDDWIVVDSKCEKTIDLLAATRREIDAALAYKVMSTRNRLPETSDEMIDAVAETFEILNDFEEFDY